MREMGKAWVEQFWAARTSVALIAANATHDHLLIACETLKRIGNDTQFT
jgi:hypothetical protein